MPGIGEQLTAAREARGMTAVDVAKRLRIRAMFVDALEREDWRTVGEPVYARGFLKNYAKLLGLDPGAAAAQLDATYPEFAARPDVPAMTRDDAATGITAPRYGETNWLVVSTGAVAAVLLIAVIWNGIPMLRGGSASGVASYASPSPVPAAVSDAGNTAAAAGATSSDSSVAPTSGVNLRIETTQACWLSVTVDGKRVVYDTLPKGAVREFHAAREINLRAGNAGGVVASIDGKPLGTLGLVGQVQDRVFAVASPAPSQTGAP